MSLSKNDIDNLKTRLNNNKSLSVTSKTNLNGFIEKTKNAFDRTAYNTRMRNLRTRDASLGLSSRNGSVSRGSANPRKRGRNSPRGPLSAVSAVSNASNNQNNASTNGYRGFSNNENNLERNAKRRKNNSQLPLVTAAQGAVRAAANKAAANNARRKAVANAKKKAIIAQQQGKAAANNARRKAVENANKKAKATAAAQAAENAKAKAKKAKAEKQEKNRKNAQNTINKAITNKRQRNANELNMLRKAKAKAAKATTNKANANAKVKTENTDRMSGRTSCPTNIRPLIQQLNNFENTANSSIKSRNKKPGEKKPTRGKLMKDGVLLEILSLSRANAEKKNAVGLKHRAYVFALLYDMFSSADLPATFFEQNVTITRNSLLTLAKHLMCVNTYSSSSNNFKSQEFTLTDMQITEFLFLMWLDGWHDKYINTSFEAFLPTLGGKKGYFDNKYINNSWKIIKDIVPENMNNNYTNRNTLIARILSTVKVIRPYIYTSTFKQIKTTGGLKGKFETPLRDAITKLLGYQMTIIPIGSTSPSINATNKHMVLLDMESEGQNISQLINASKKLNPYLASASLIDPGRHYLKYYNLVKDIRSIRSWFEYANQNESFLNFNTRYHVGPTNMILKDSNGNIFLNVNLTVNVSGVKQTNLSKISNDSFFTLTLNNKEVNMGTTAGNAKNAGLKSNMGKFMGDALQYMTVIVQNNTRSRNRVFASGDGNACFMYTHLCKCIGQTPRIIIDKGGAVVYHGID